MLDDFRRCQSVDLFELIASFLMYMDVGIKQSSLATYTVSKILIDFLYLCGVYFDNLWQRMRHHQSALCHLCTFNEILGRKIMFTDK